MSLDVSLMVTKPTEVFTANITHNLSVMAKEVGIYEALWRPEEINVKIGADLIPLLTEGLRRLKIQARHLRQFDAANGWGRHEHLVSFVQNYLEACKENPDAEVRVCR